MLETYERTKEPTEWAFIGQISSLIRYMNPHRYT